MYDLNLIHTALTANIDHLDADDQEDVIEMRAQLSKRIEERATKDADMRASNRRIERTAKEILEIL